MAFTFLSSKELICKHWSNLYEQRTCEHGICNAAATLSASHWDDTLLLMKFLSHLKYVFISQKS